MNTTIENPQTLQEAVEYFAVEENAFAFMVSMVWPKGVACPHCGGADPYFLKTRQIWKCKACHKQFSIKTGTIMEDSPLPLKTWLAVVWMLANAKNGISSYEVHRALGVTQKTGWFLLHRVRAAMKVGSFRLMNGTVEADESYIGGKSRNMHKNRRQKITGTGGAGKTAVMGLLERHSEKGKSKVRTAIVSTTKRHELQAQVRKNVEAGANVYTDALASYRGLSLDFAHDFIDHAERYVNGNVHTNGLENFWSLFKRTIRGTYIACEPFHLDAYLDEQCFRFNNRETTDAVRFVRVLESITGKRLTYSALIGDTGAVSSSASDGAVGSA